MKLLLLCIIIVGISAVLLGIKVLFVKGGKFPSGHIGQSVALRNKGIRCAHSEKE